MSLRRYLPLKSTPGTRVPDDVRRWVTQRDMGRCVGPLVGMAPPCQGSLEQDHVRASHGMGMKSESISQNLVTLCAFHHRVKTENGARWRPALMDYIDRVESGGY